MADLGRSAEAIRLFDAALSQRRNPVIAAQLVEYLIGLGTSDARAKARQVLSDPDLNVAGTWQLKLMEAGLSIIDGNQARGVSQALQSFEMVRGDTSGVVRWFNALPPIVKDHRVRMEIALQLGVEQTPERVGEIMLASLMLEDPSTEPQGMSELRRLAGDSNTTVALRAGQLLGDTLYGKGDYQGAVDAWRGVLAIDANVGQSLNNLAFVLATQLGQCEQAIAHAQKALEVGGISPAIGLSTLAVALTKCNRIDEAQQAVEQLMNFARGNPEEVLAVVRQGEIHLARGEVERARESLGESRVLVEAWGGRAAQYESVVASFEAAMEGR
jgi:tetratricopeptide (TPR) repeat protein